MPQVNPGCRVTARSASLTYVNLRGAPNPTYKTSRRQHRNRGGRGIPVWNSGPAPGREEGRIRV